MNSDSTPTPLSVFIPEVSAHLIASLEEIVTRGNYRVEFITFKTLGELEKEVSLKERPCILGELSATWRDDSFFFEGVDASSINWPPVYCISPQPLTGRELAALSASGVIWAATSGQFVESNVFDKLLSGTLWSTRHGLVYQKLARKSIEFGEVLVVLSGEESRFGRIEFKNGNILAAQCESFSGYEALYAMSLVNDWRIDLHTLFIGLEPKTMNSTMMNVVEQLVELADDRQGIFLMARPPGATRELPPNLMVGIRSLLNDKDEISTEDVSDQQGLADEEKLIYLESVVNDPKSDPEKVEDLVLGGFVAQDSAEAKDVEKMGIADDSVGIRENNREKVMTGNGLKEFLTIIPGAIGGAAMESDGACLEVAGELDFETAPIVTAMALEHLADLAKVLGIQGLKVACFSGDKQSLFIARKSGTYLFTLGSLVKNPGVVAGKLE
jgi:hypothetical protein